MKPFLALVALVLLAGCAHLGPNTRQQERTAGWREAHAAFEAGEYPRSAELFSSLAERHPDTVEGRESLFYAAAIHLDPLNTEWDPGPAERLLSRYLDHEEEEPGILHRRPEGEMLFRIAEQLNMPPRQRVPGLQPEVVTEQAPAVTRRVVVPAEESRALAAEVDRLRAQIAERDATIQQQREELERIRRTLTRPST